MKIVKDTITLGELKPMSEKMFGGLVKAVVDIDQQIMAVDAPMHADQEFLLLEEEGSKQEHLWGINLYPNQFGTDGFIVFDSMINLRPGFGNKTRGVDDPKIQEIIKKIVNKMVVP